MKPAKIIWSCIIVIVALLVTWLVHYDLLKDPAHAVHAMGGDAIKNYFVYIYHALYGHGWRFDGMNYPYGEHIMFVDGQPLLTITLAWLRNWIHLTPEVLNAVLNLLLTGSFFVAIIYVYKILLKFDVSRFWSVVFAVLIATMSVQNFRVYGLYGLSYACVIPMMFYWYICYHQTGKRKYMLWMTLFAVIITFLHPYLLALVLIWSGLYILGYMILISATVKEKLRHLLPIIAMLATAIIVLQIVSFMTDPIKDRTTYPHGLLSYRTSLENLYTLYYSPYSTWLKDAGIIQSLSEDSVAYSYIGIIALVISIGAIVMAVYYIIRKNKTALNAILPERFSKVFLFVGLGALLFSMGVPFIWGLDFLYDYIAQLRQFRALNYFGLLFYYVAAVFAVVLLYNLAIKKVGAAKPMRGLVILLIAALIWGYESYGVAAHIRKQSFIVKNHYEYFYSKKEKSWNELLKYHDLKAEDFQAILHLSYHHVGSEKVWLYRSAYGLGLAMKAATQLHLPLVDANMSRSSWSQAFKQIKINAGPYTHKSILYEVADKRPYLVMYFEYDELNPDEQYLLEHAKLIGTTSNMKAYILYPEDLRNSDEQLQQQARDIAANITTDTSLAGSDMFYKHYDDAGNKKALFGTGAAMAVDRDTSFEVIDVTGWHRGIPYEASGWFLVNDYDYRSPSIKMDIFDKHGNNLLVEWLPCSKTTDVHDMWFRASSYFTLPDSATTIVLGLQEHGKPSYYSMDEVLIRQVADTVISKDVAGRIMVNNHLLP